MTNKRKIRLRIVGASDTQEQIQSEAEIRIGISNNPDHRILDSSNCHGYICPTKSKLHLPLILEACYISGLHGAEFQSCASDILKHALRIVGIGRKKPLVLVVAREELNNIQIVVMLMFLLVGWEQPTEEPNRSQAIFTTRVILAAELQAKLLNDLDLNQLQQLTQEAQTGSLSNEAYAQELKAWFKKQFERCRPVSSG